MYITALIEKATNEFIEDGRFEDPALYARIPVPRTPDARRERYSGNPADPFVAKSAGEIQASLDAKVTAQAGVKSRHKDVLATVAWAIRLKDPAAWAAKTIAQKKAQVLAEADAWRDLRVFIEQNL